MSNDVNIAEERAVSLTLLDLKQAPKLFELTESLARELALAMDADSDELSLARPVSQVPDSRRQTVR